MSSILGNLIGEEGIKTDLKVTIAPVNYIYLGVALFVGMVASRIVANALLK